MRRWGDEWFVNKEAGGALRELWSLGQRYDVLGLLERVGEPALDMRPLVVELNAA